MKRYWLLLVLVLVGAMVWAGGSTETAKPAATHISFMHFFKQDDPNADANNKSFYVMFPKFKAAHPDVVFDVEDLTHDTYDTKIKTIAAANQMPDLFLVKGSWVDTFVGNGLMKPINDVLDANATWRDGFYPGALSEFVRNGTDIYGVTFQLFTTSLVFYNDAILKKAGIESFPKTSAEFETAVGKLNAIGVTPVALGNKAKWVAESCILSTLGDRYTGTEWFNSIRDRKGASFSDPLFVKSLAALKRLAEIKTFNPDMNSIDNNQQRTLYMNGSAAMFMEGAWAVSSLVDTAPKDILAQTKLAVLPSVVGGKGDPASFSGGSGWAYTISSQTDAAKRRIIGTLLPMLTGADIAKITIENNGQPASKPVSYDKSKLAPLANAYFDLVAQNKFTPIYDIQLEAPVIEVMNSGLQELLAGSVSPQDLAARIQTEYMKQ